MSRPKGLLSWVSWRTFIVGLLIGCAVTYGLHWASTFHPFGRVVHELPW